MYVTNPQTLSSKSFLSVFPATDGVVKQAVTNRNIEEYPPEIMSICV